MNLTQNNLGDIIIIGGGKTDYFVFKYKFPPILYIIMIFGIDETLNKGLYLKVNFKTITGN
jgi:hypothetical protein